MPRAPTPTSRCGWRSSASSACVLDPAIVEEVVEHGNEDRFRNHKIPIKTSYAAGYLYRKAKTALIRMRRRPNLPPAVPREALCAALKAGQAS